MRRREFITLIGGAAVALPLTAAVRAQSPDRPRRVGVLMGPLAEDDAESRARVVVLRNAFAKLGWTEGRNIQLEYRYARGDSSQVNKFAKELVALQPEAIIGVSTPAALALKRETSAIPIVFVNVTDPVGVGLAASIAQPGGNSTGLTYFEPNMAGKWLQMLKEVAPSIGRVAVLYSPKTLPPFGFYLRAIQAAAPSFAVEPIPTPAIDATEIERAINIFAREPNGSLLVLPDVTPTSNRGLVLGLAARNSLPAVYPFGYLVRDGGLMSYGVDVLDQFGQLALYVDRILNGITPAGLPVQAPTKFELILNLKTAKKLGLTVPPSLLIAATEVIE